MTNLKTTIGDVSNLVFVSDRHSIVTNEIEVAFPISYHELCTYHLSKNVKTHFKDEAANKLFNSVSIAYREFEVKGYWEQILNYRL